MRKGAEVRGGEGATERSTFVVPGVTTPHSAAPGQGHVRVACVDGCSVVTHAYATSPLRLLTPSNHGSAAWVYLSSYGGGMVDGDCVSLDVDVDRGATAFLSTQASTKVYRSPNGTSTTVRAHVAADGLLVVAPDPVVCFAGSGYTQRQRFVVDQGGAVVVADAVVAGRCTSGERWAFREYRSVIEVLVGGRMLVYDPVALCDADGDLRMRMGRFDVLAVVVMAGAAVGDVAQEILDRGSAMPVERRASMVMATSPLPDGCIVRIAATAVAEVRRAVRGMLHGIVDRFEDDPWARKW